MRRQFELWTDRASDPCKNARRSPCDFSCKSQLVTRKLVTSALQAVFLEGFSSVVHKSDWWNSCLVLVFPLKESTRLRTEWFSQVMAILDAPTSVRNPTQRLQDLYIMICLERSNKRMTMRNDSIRVHGTLSLNEGAMACIHFYFFWLDWICDDLCVTLYRLCLADEHAGLYFLARRWGK